MDDILWLDLETYCEVPIKTAHAYAEQVEITVFAWALNDGPVHVEDVASNPLSNELCKLLNNPNVNLLLTIHILTVLFYATLCQNGP